MFVKGKNAYIHARFLLLATGSPNSITTKPWAGSPKNQDLISWQEKETFLFSKIPRPVLGSSSAPFSFSEIIKLKVCGMLQENFEYKFFIT